MSLYAALRAGLGFFTRIPVGIDMPGLEALQRHQYLYPIFGLFIGLVLAGIAIAAGMILPPLALSIVIITVLYAFTGFNHLDGLSDFGDGLAAHGTPEKRVAAMKDVSIGVGGVAFAVLGLLALFAALSSVADVPRSLVVAEVTAKTGMIAVGLFGEKLHDGLGSLNVEYARPHDLFIGALISLAVGWLILGPAGLAGVVSGLLAALIVERTARSVFGGVSGDVVGASNELCRIAALFGVIAWMS